MPPSTTNFSTCWTNLEEAAALFFRAKAHDILHASAVVPTAVEEDDFARRRKMLGVTLDEDLRFSRGPRERGVRQRETHAGSLAL